MSNQKGFTLVEVLVAAFILATALLGYGATQALSLKNAKSAYHRSQATNLASDLVDRIRTNNDPAALAEYQARGSTPGQLTEVAGCTNASSGCTPVQMADTDLRQWSDNIGRAIRGGTGTLTFAGGLYTITITWTDSTGTQTNFTTTFRL